MPFPAWPSPAEAESASARAWERAFHLLDAEHQALRLRYWDERTCRTVAEAELIVESYANIELQSLHDIEGP